MRALLSPEEMRRADERTISSGVPAEVLMERAGSAVARHVIALAGRRYGVRAAVVCGKGNNGGDGFVAARLLAEDGVSTRCLLVGDAGAARGPAGRQLAQARSSPARVEPFAPRLLAGCDVIVDALFGTGFKGIVEGEAAAVIEAMGDAGAPVLAVDIPSGVTGATGAVHGPAVTAALTVVMGAEKVGTAVGAGAARSGHVEVVDIGIAVTGGRVSMIEADDVSAVLPRRPLDSHKRSSGAVALLGGSAGMTGAVTLAARASVRMGAGYTTFGATAEVERAVSQSLPEVLSNVVAEGQTLGPESLDAFRPTLEKATALAVGPGLGSGSRQRALVERVLGEVELPVVLDADGLNVLAGHTAALEARSHPTVLSPHPAELARLVDTSIDALQEDRVGAAQAAARRFGCAVVLKGYRSVTASPGGLVAVNPTGTPDLATAGTGDVLTGALAALLAAGLDPYVASWAAVYVHGRAGSVARGRVGGPGVLAWDVAEALPEAVESLLTRTRESSSPGARPPALPGNLGQ
jgi:ADP-dependent NAD(P)H-hydrate dehydratase / NAD(P)H-hydrate epimerase